MTQVIPRFLYVSATDTTAPWSCLSKALRQAAAGDTVVVGPGRYAPSQTGEEFPLYVPPGVTLTGSGQGVSIIDGEGATQLSFRPVQAGQSLVLMADQTTLSGFSILNSGGNGISNQLGARIMIVRNEIRQHGQHGVLLSGPQEAIVKDNVFLENGTKQFRPVTPRPAAGRQGHHIFIQGKGGAANSIVITDNTMRRAFADGMAMVVFFDEANGVGMHIRIMNNVIEQSERRGLTIAGSFGPCHTRVCIDVRHNVIRHNEGPAIAAQAARPLVTQLIRDSFLRLHIADNKCRSNSEGLLLFGGFGPAEDSVLEATIVNNLIAGTARHAVRAIGGVGFGGYGAYRNRVHLALAQNRCEAIGDVPVYLQGGACEGQEAVTGNAVYAQLARNDLLAGAGQPTVLVNDGLAGNMVSLQEPVPLHEHVLTPLPYQP